MKLDYLLAEVSFPLQILTIAYLLKSIGIGTFKMYSVV